MADTFPWPRPEGEEGTLIQHPRFEQEIDPGSLYRSDDFQAREFTDQWDRYDTAMYNAWVGVTVVPTHFFDEDLTYKLGIMEGVLHILSRAGTGRLGLEPYHLYPDLVRQFMATLRLRFRSKRDAHTGELHFKLHGRKYTLPLDEFADLYGLDTSSRASTIPSFGDRKAFYEHICNGGYTDGGAHAHSNIRHPALRYASKVIASSLFGKNETNKLRKSELFFLYLGLDEAYPGTRRERDQMPHVGAIFARHLITLQTVPFVVRGRTLRIGSLLTPIFVRCGEAARAEDPDTRIWRLNEEYFVQGHHLSTAGDWYYSVGADTRTIHLDQESVRIDTMEAIAFRPDQPAEQEEDEEHDTPEQMDEEQAFSDIPDEEYSPPPPSADVRAMGQWEVRRCRRRISAARRLIESLVSRQRD